MTKPTSDDLSQNHAIASKCSRRNDPDFKPPPADRCGKNRVTRPMRILAGLDVSEVR